MLFDDPKNLRVEVHGGSSADRQLLSTSITALLQREGFKSVSGFMEGGVEKVSTKRMLATTVADIVEQSRPDLFNARVSVMPMPAPKHSEDAPVKLLAIGPNNFSVQDTRGDVKEFLEMAEDYRAENDITVVSSSPEKVGKVISELLEMNETIVVKGQVIDDIGRINLVVTQF